MIVGFNITRSTEIEVLPLLMKEVSLIIIFDQTVFDELEFNAKITAYTWCPL